MFVERLVEPPIMGLSFLIAALEHVESTLDTGQDRIRYLNPATFFYSVSVTNNFLHAREYRASTESFRRRYHLILQYAPDCD